MAKKSESQKDYTIEQLIAVSGSEKLDPRDLELVEFIENNSYDSVTTHLVELFEKGLLPSKKISELQDYMGSYYTGFVQKVKV